MRPYTEVVLFDFTRNINGKLWVSNNTFYKLKENSIKVLWRGSISQFKTKFEIPQDAPLSTKETGLSTGDSAAFVEDWNLTTLNFKFNYHVWYRDSHGSNSSNNYVIGSNNTINLTIPNVLVFDGNQSNDNSIKFDTDSLVPDRLYNPNIFPLPISINSFITSNKRDDFQAVTGSGTNSECYLVFRYRIDSAGSDSDRQDIEICLLTRDSGAFQVNSQTLIIPYATLTFTGFNKLK